MKKLLLVLFALFSLSVNAQVFNYKMVLDKFDDVLDDGYQKTLVQIGEEKLVIEEKGKTPNTYYFIMKNTSLSQGDKNNIVNIINDLYGYDESWFIVAEADFDEFQKKMLEYSLSEEENTKQDVLSNIVHNYCLLFTHRVVTTQYTHDFIAELVWIQDNKTSQRTIYSNHD